MAQRFGLWDAAVDRELLNRIKGIVEVYRQPEQEEYLDGDDAIQAIVDAINETEGTDL